MRSRHDSNIPVTFSHEIDELGQSRAQGSRHKDIDADTSPMQRNLRPSNLFFAKIHLWFMDCARSYSWLGQVRQTRVKDRVKTPNESVISEDITYEPSTGSRVPLSPYYLEVKDEERYLLQYP
jgi:hypothetical protein